MSDVAARTVRSVHAHQAIGADPRFEIELADHLRATSNAAALMEIYGRFAHGEGAFDGLMRRVVLRALVRRFGSGIVVGRGVLFRHPETFDIAKDGTIRKKWIGEANWASDANVALIRDLLAK